jgi:hypothetical protein
MPPQLVMEPLLSSQTLLCLLFERYNHDFEPKRRFAGHWPLDIEHLRWLGFHLLHKLV